MHILWSLGIKNQEALYWENINQGNILQGIPVYEFYHRNEYLQVVKCSIVVGWRTNSILETYLCPDTDTYLLHVIQLVSLSVLHVRHWCHPLLQILWRENQNLFLLDSVN
jgi:hypothetical protein